MARPSKARTADELNAVDKTINHGELIAAGDALKKIAANVSAVEETLGIVMPYHVESYVARIRLNMQETGQRLIEIGVMLAEIREREDPTTYRGVLDRLDLSERFARRAIQTAVKVQGLPKLQTLGSSKVLELLSEDDDTLDALEHGGTLAGLTLDEVDSMSVRELKATLRAERAERQDEKSTDEEIIRAKDERINKLTRDKRRGSDANKLRAAAEDILRDADEAVVEAASHIARLRKAFGDVEQLYADAGAAVEGDIAERLDGNARWAADQLRDLADLLGE
ncbi:MAG: hypothetical protein J0H50_10550 [Xanthomonadales bacterium]|nr:hypothetical protein [Xanthomonadales bacterium]